MVNFVVCQDFGLEFFAKAKHLRPRPAICKAKAKDTKFGLKAKVKAKD